MTANDRRRLTDALTGMRMVQANLLDLVRAEQGCISCINLHDGQCSEWNAAVPKTTIPNGCEHWRSDDIPF
jgi:hypothetical protein